MQLALLLDTSNSMDGLIDQARAQLWSEVNEMSQMEKDCKPVQLQVAPFQCGNNDLESADGFIQLRAPFTTDLDIISERLFALRTNGGSEFCGQVIQAAADRLNWIAPSDEPGAPSATRMIVIAGNEPFIQGATPYQPRSPARPTRASRCIRFSVAPKMKASARSGRTAPRLAKGGAARSITTVSRWMTRRCSGKNPRRCSNSPKRSKSFGRPIRGNAKLLI